MLPENGSSHARSAGALPSTGTFGDRIILAADRLACWSDSTDGLSCTYLRPAHLAAAGQLRDWMASAGLQAKIDSVGNVVGRYPSTRLQAKTLVIGSHYDTVLNAGRYDGRLGILTGLVIAEYLAKANTALPFHLEVIGFSEEEGVRFPVPYFGSAAVVGRFDPQWLDRRDAAGTTLASAMRDAGLDPAGISHLARRSEDLLGYIEVHIEQGPVLLQQGLPLGIVSAIAGAIRFAVTVTGDAGHAGTVPMTLRHDALAAAAETILAVERRCSAVPRLVGTVGRIQVANAASNVIPSRCDLSLDIRAADDHVRDAAIEDIRTEMLDIQHRRSVKIEVNETFRTPAVACSPHLQSLLARTVKEAGITPYSLDSGAGHDAVMFAGLTETAMLFVRSGNGGISHSPRESVTPEDADIGARVLLNTILAMAAERGG